MKKLITILVLALCSYTLVARNLNEGTLKFLGEPIDGSKSHVTQERVSTLVNEYAWLVGTWSVNTPEFGRITLIIKGDGQKGRMSFAGESGSYETKDGEIRCHIDGDPKDLVTVFKIHSGNRLYFGEGYYFSKVK